MSNWEELVTELVAEHERLMEKKEMPYALSLPGGVAQDFLTEAVDALHDKDTRAIAELLDQAVDHVSTLTGVNRPEPKREFTAYLTGTRRLRAEVTVDARSEEEAEELIKELHDRDEISWDEDDDIDDFDIDNIDDEGF